MEIEITEKIRKEINEQSLTEILKHHHMTIDEFMNSPEREAIEIELKNLVFAKISDYEWEHNPEKMKVTEERMKSNTDLKASSKIGIKPLSDNVIKQIEKNDCYVLNVFKDDEREVNVDVYAIILRAKRCEESKDWKSVCQGIILGKENIEDKEWYIHVDSASIEKDYPNADIKSAEFKWKDPHPFIREAKYLVFEAVNKIKPEECIDREYISQDNVAWIWKLDESQIIDVVEHVIEKEKCPTEEVLEEMFYKSGECIKLAEEIKNGKKVQIDNIEELQLVNEFVYKSGDGKEFMEEKDREFIEKLKSMQWEFVEALKEQSKEEIIKK